MINTISENKKILQLDRTHSTEFDYAWLDMLILETILIEIMHRHHHCCRHLHHHVIMIINVDSARERKRCLTRARSCMRSTNTQLWSTKKRIQTIPSALPSLADVPALLLTQPIVRIRM